MVNNSVTIITLQPEYTIASIYCKAVELESANYIPIIEGDYVGVALPSSNQIPLIGDTSAYDILVHSNTQEMITLAFNNFDERRLALHLYVDIGMIVIKLLISFFKHCVCIYDMPCFYVSFFSQ